VLSGGKRINKLSQLQQGPSPIEAALQAYLEGRSALCLSLLRGGTSAPESFLRARAHLRLGEIDRAISELAGFSPSELDDDALAAEQRFLLAAAFAATGSTDSAIGAHDDADRFAQASGDVTLITESRYYRALTYLMSGNLEQAYAVASVAQSTRPGSVDARVLGLLGHIIGASGDRARQIRMYRAALDRLGQSKRDFYVEATLLVDVLAAYLEFDPLNIPASLLARVETFPWNEELVEQQFGAYRALAWHHAFAGSPLAVFRAFGKLKTLGLPPLYRVWLLAECSAFSRDIGEPVTAADMLNEAESLLEQIDWRAASFEERGALLRVAILVAAHAPATATALIKRYRVLGSPSTTWVDPLLRAFEVYAFGIVAKADAGAGFASGPTSVFLQSAATGGRLSSPVSSYPSMRDPNIGRRSTSRSPAFQNHG
jgi:tetratricopeptide (TPR) repeat protein